MAQGFTYREIEKILLLDERTLNRYKHHYKEQGIDGLTLNNYQGGRYKLSDEQRAALQRELDAKIFRTAEEIRDYVKKIF